MPDIDTGNDLVQRHDDHAKDGRNRKGDKKAAYALRTHFVRFGGLLHTSP